MFAAVTTLLLLLLIICPANLLLMIMISHSNVRQPSCRVASVKSCQNIIQYRDSFILFRVKKKTIQGNKNNTKE